MADELSAPLLNPKARRAAARSGRRPLPLARLGFLAILLIFSGLAVRMALVEDPEGGRPSAEVSIDTTRDANPVASQVALPSLPAEPATITAGPETATPLANGPSITTLDGGVDDETILEIANATQPNAFGVIPDLSEETADGAIPRVSADGRTPFALYSRPVDTAGIGNKPRIAVIVTGLGLNEAGTLDAIARLSEDVTLAFAPYGRTLDRTTGAARAEGHELFLEIPLEPFDYPDNDPGPETLLTGESPRSNIEKLYWLLGRFGGYAGVINNMGARFTASGGDFTPVMEELAARGIGYLDDGSSNRSVAPQLAEANKVPFTRADMMLDTNPARGTIMAALTALEGKARANGHAVGLITALPVSVQTVAEWAKGLNERGFALVPASALMSRP